jgi:hypothetical protein
MIATDAVKRGVAPFDLEARVIAAVVVNPQAEKDRGNRQREDQGTCGEVEHAKDDASAGCEGNALSRQKRRT